MMVPSLRDTYATVRVTCIFASRAVIIALFRAPTIQNDEFYMLLKIGMLVKPLKLYVWEIFPFRYVWSMPILLMFVV